MTFSTPASIAPRARAGARFAALAVALAMLVCAGSATAQQPTPSTLAAAKELIETKGALGMFDPLIPGVIESVKNTLLRTSPQLSKDLNEVSAQLRAEYAPKRADVSNEVARAYAEQFTEKELKDLTAFFKTPLGKKVLEAEPRAVELSMTRVQAWSERLSEEMFGRFRAEMRKKGHNL
jgi:uncharacterized protein